MNAKEYLNQLLFFDRETKAMQTTLRTLRSSMMSAKGQDLNGMPKGDSNPHKFDSLVVLEDMIIHRKDELIELKKEIYETIQKVEDSKQRTFLMYRYLNGYSVIKIANLLYMSERTAKRLAKASYESVEKILKEDRIEYL